MQVIGPLPYGHCLGKRKACTVQNGSKPKSLKRMHAAAPNNHPCSPTLAPSTHRKTTRGPRSKHIPKSEPRALANGSKSEADFRNRKHHRAYSVRSLRSRFRFRQSASIFVRFWEHVRTEGREPFFHGCWSPMGVSMGGLRAFCLMVRVWLVMCCARFPFTTPCSSGLACRYLHAQPLSQTARANAAEDASS